MDASTPALPDYAPPHATRTAVAVGAAPIVVVLAFSAVVCGLIEADVGFAVFAACTAWVVAELYRFQKSVGRYDEAYAQQHLSQRWPLMPGDAPAP